MVQVMRGRVLVNLGTEEEPKVTVVPVAATCILDAADRLVERGYGRPQQPSEVSLTVRDLRQEADAAREQILSQLNSIAEREREAEDRRKDP